MKPATLRRRLVAQLRTHGLASKALADAFLAVPRELFVEEVLAEHGLEFVYSDRALLVKQDAQRRPLSSSSQPAMMAQMLELLELEPGHRVLEIGAGTGYNAALMSHMVGPDGRVVTIDIDPELARRARRALRRSGHSATVLAADGRAGSARHAPYDRIIVTACAEAIEPAWFEQLRDGGRIVVPLRLDGDPDALQLIPALERRGRRLTSVGLTWGGFMPIHDGDGGWKRPAAVLTASMLGGERHRSLATLSGDGTLKLRPVDATAVLSQLLAHEPTSAFEKGLTPLAGGHTPLIIAYLLTRIPRARRIWVRVGKRHGIGLVDARSRSAAAVTVPDIWVPMPGRVRTRVTWQLHDYGRTENAARNLSALTNEFRALHNPAPEITASLMRGRIRIRTRWTSGPRRPGRLT